MAELLVIPGITIPAEDWTWDTQLGVWTATTARICPLTQGREYRMYGDGSGYEPSAAQDIGALIGMPMVAVGGLDPFGMPSNGSPYVIGDGGSFNMFAVTNRGQSYPPGDVTFSLAMMVKGNVIFQGQALEFEVADDGLAHTNVSPAPFELVLGETYGVVIDGMEHELVCTEYDQIPGLVTFDLDNEDPVDGDFAIVYLSVEMSSGESQVTFIIQGSTKAAAHTIAIYQIVEEEQRIGNDVVLLSYSQTPVRYDNVPKIWLTHPDSTEDDVKLVPFTHGEAVSKSVDVDFTTGDMPVEIPAGELVTELTVKKPEELKPENIPEGMYIAGVGPGTFQGGAETVETTVALDFSGGDMSVVPEEGKVFSKVSIPVPEGLIPANIAEGVKIAGIIGAFKGGGGALVKYGSFTTPSTFKAGNRISVDIGFKPEILIVLRKSGVTEGKGTIYLGLSNAFAGVCGTAYMTTVIWKDTYSTYSASYTTGIDTTLTGNFIYNADETGFNFGGSYPPAPSTAYSYVAIGGLT